MSGRPQQGTASRRSGTASFSIVVETENLAFEGPDALERCIECLKSQDLDLAAANEVIITKSGDLPAGLEARLKADLDFLRFREIPEEAGYYGAKMLAAAETTGDIVVFCDCDVEYEPGWLRAMVTSFSAEEDVRFVCGETSYRVTGPYSLAVLLSFLFPPFSGRHRMRKARGYAANSFAMRRDLLESHPIPTGRGLHHGNCDVHARQLRRAGVAIWQQPDARAYHPLLRPSRFFARFFLGGHHARDVQRRESIRHEDSNPISPIARQLFTATGICARQMMLPCYRLPAALREDPRRLLLLPFAAPLVLAATVTFLVGFFVTVLRPDLDFSAWSDRS